MSRNLDLTPRPGPAAFPITPQTNTKARQRISNALKREALVTPVNSSNGSDGPWIPLTTLDAPTQRMFAAAGWVLLFSWKLLNWFSLDSSNTDTEGFYLFMKWVAFDAIFIFAISALRMPWLTWSPSTVVGILIFHTILDAILMFRIALPLGLMFEGLWKMLWDTELTISEKRVKPMSLVDHSQLIVGKQTINILPEGSAILNPDHYHFCIGGSINQVQLPLQINQTQPILIELYRQDLEGETRDTLSIKSSESKKLRKAAIQYHKNHKGPHLPHDPLTLHYTVYKPGRYTIKKVVDETKLVVRPKDSEVIVVQCPSVKITTDSTNRCRGELSDVAFEVHGTPPLKLKYRKLINGNPSEASFQSIQPDGFMSPLIKRYQQAVVKSIDTDFSWAKSQTVKVPINETMIVLGKYSFAIDEVQDGFGNIVQYSSGFDDEDNRNKSPEISESLTVYDRPLVFIPKNAGCNSEKAIRIASGREALLPHVISSVGKTEAEIEFRNDYNFAEDHFIEYEWTPESQLNIEFDSRKRQHLKVKKTKPGQGIVVKEPGLYTLKGISTSHCRGEVVEPSACLLENPNKPSVQISSSEITHKCANSPIGLRVDLEFVGNPPFTIHYIEENGYKKHARSRRFEGHRDQIELTPVSAGHYKYTFMEINDLYYEGIRVNEVLQQNVRPSASANIDENAIRNVQDICIGQNAEFGIFLIGDAPWTLEYEIIHGRSKQKAIISDITDSTYKLVVSDIKDGGEYTLSLTSVSDSSGCKEFLKQEAKFQVWSKVPTAAFGTIANQHYVQILEGKSIPLPLKFTGQPSFGYTIENLDVQDVLKQSGNHANEVFSVKNPGTYVIKQIRDKFCPGIVDSTADKFVVNFISRPSLSISQHDTITAKGSKYIKQEICEGAEDFTEINFSGTPPFDLTYEEHAKPEDGSKSVKKRDLNSAYGLATISMDTSRAGYYEYKFHDVSDANYNPHAKSRSDIILQQTVYPRPTAKFTNPEKVYNYCTSEGSDDTSIPIPIHLTGVPPFEIDLDLRSSGTVAPESITLNNIQTKDYEIRLPRKYLRVGHASLTIRRVKDGRTCQSKDDPSIEPSRIQISVHNPPQIYAEDPKQDVCVSEKVFYRLQGVPPFTVYWTLNGESKSAIVQQSKFERLTDKPGELIITGLADSSSACKFSTELRKTIHPLPKVLVNQGRDHTDDIHEGGELDFPLEFFGTAPFEYTFTRSNLAGSVQETRTDRTNESKVTLRGREAGIYDVISIRDRWCGVAKNTGAKGREPTFKLLPGGIA